MLSRNIAAVASVALTTSLFAAPVDYIKDVKPILAQHCYRCHGASQQKSGMRADTAAFLRTGGDSGPSLVAGKANESLLIKTILGTHDDIAQMPYKKPPLAEAKIEVLRAWINEGAVAPANEEPEKNIHWAFAAPVRADVPAVTRQGWSQNPIDAFIFARLENEKTPIAPSPRPTASPFSAASASISSVSRPRPPRSRRSSPTTLRPPLQLPPLQLRLAAKPRLAASSRASSPRRTTANAGRARGSTSRAMPIPTATRSMPPPDLEIPRLGRRRPQPRSALRPVRDRTTRRRPPAECHPRPKSCHRLQPQHPDQPRGRHRSRTVPHRSRARSRGHIGTAFLGLTVGCAQCHDHKFDPITQREFYQLYAIFNNTVDDGHGKSTPGGTLAFASENSADETALRELETQQADFEKFLDEHKGPVVAWFAALDGMGKTNLGGTAREALDVPWANLNFAQKRAVFAAYPQVDADFKARQLKHSGLERRPSRRLTTLVMSELKKPRESVIFIKGDFTRRGDPVQPGTPAILPPSPSPRPTASISRAGFSNPTTPSPPA